jgi:hypothetical protein
LEPRFIIQFLTTSTILVFVFGFFLPAASHILAPKSEFVGVLQRNKTVRERVEKNIKN